MANAMVPLGYDFLSDLPGEVIIKIADKLDPQDLFRLGQVSQNFRWRIPYLFLRHLPQSFLIYDPMWTALARSVKNPEKYRSSVPYQELRDMMNNAAPRTIFQSLPTTKLTQYDDRDMPILSLKGPRHLTGLDNRQRLEAMIGQARENVRGVFSSSKGWLYNRHTSIETLAEQLAKSVGEEVDEYLDQMQLVLNDTSSQPGYLFGFQNAQGMWIAARIRVKDLRYDREGDSLTFTLEDDDARMLLMTYMQQLNQHERSPTDRQLRTMMRFEQLRKYRPQERDWKLARYRLNSHDHWWRTQIPIAAKALDKFHAYKRQGLVDLPATTLTPAREAQISIAMSAHALMNQEEYEENLRQTILRYMNSEYLLDLAVATWDKFLDNRRVVLDNLMRYIIHLHTYECDWLEPSQPRTRR